MEAVTCIVVTGMWVELGKWDESPNGDLLELNGPGVELGICTGVFEDVWNVVDKWTGLFVLNATCS